MGNKIYVGNLNYRTSNDALADMFQNFGTVTSCRIITDRDTGSSKGFGFVEMESDDEARAAIEGANGQVLDGRNLKVNEAQDRPAGGSRW